MTYITPPTICRKRTSTTTSFQVHVYTRKRRRTSANHHSKWLSNICLLFPRIIEDNYPCRRSDSTLAMTREILIHTSIPCSSRGKLSRAWAAFTFSLNERWLHSIVTSERRDMSSKEMWMCQCRTHFCWFWRNGEDKQMHGENRFSFIVVFLSCYCFCCLSRGAQQTVWSRREDAFCFLENVSMKTASKVDEGNRCATDRRIFGVWKKGVGVKTREPVWRSACTSLTSVHSKVLAGKYWKRMSDWKRKG